MQPALFFHAPKTKLLRGTCNWDGCAKERLRTLLTDSYRRFRRMTTCGLVSPIQPEGTGEGGSAKIQSGHAQGVVGGHPQGVGAGGE